MTRTLLVTNGAHADWLAAADLVTETDKAVEKMVSTTLLEKYPSYSFMGEETYEPGLLPYFRNAYLPHS